MSRGQREDDIQSLELHVLYYLVLMHVASLRQQPCAFPISVAGLWVGDDVCSFVLLQESNDTSLRDLDLPQLFQRERPPRQRSAVTAIHPVLERLQPIQARPLFQHCSARLHSAAETDRDPLHRSFAMATLELEHKEVVGLGAVISSRCLTNKRSMAVLNGCLGTKHPGMISTSILLSD